VKLETQYFQVRSSTTVKGPWKWFRWLEFGQRLL